MLAMVRLRAVIALAVLWLLAAAFADADVGFLFVNSKPPGGEVTIDSTSLLLTPTPVLCTLAVGTHQVRVSKPGYRTAQATVSIDRGRVRQETLTLKRQTSAAYGSSPPDQTGRGLGALTVLTDVPDAQLALDGVVLRETAPTTIERIEAGEHRVRLGYEGLTVDTVITVVNEYLTVLSMPMAHLLRQHGLAPAGRTGAVPVLVVVKVPGCRYRRADERLPLKSNIMLAGVDTKLRLTTRDTVIQLSHYNLATAVSTNSHGEVVSMTVPETTLTYQLVVAEDDTIAIAVVTAANPGLRFASRDELHPHPETYVIPGDFNSGQAINIRILIDGTGDVIFRYW